MLRKMAWTSSQYQDNVTSAEDLTDNQDEEESPFGAEPLFPSSKGVQCEISTMEAQAHVEYKRLLINIAIVDEHVQSFE